MPTLPPPTPTATPTPTTPTSVGSPDFNPRWNYRVFNVTYEPNCGLTTIEGNVVNPDGSSREGMKVRVLAAIGTYGAVSNFTDKNGYHDVTLANEAKAGRSSRSTSSASIGTGHNPNRRTPHLVFARRLRGGADRAGLALPPDRPTTGDQPATPGVAGGNK